MAKDYRSYSFWLDSVGDLTPRPRLETSADVDVAIIGAGYTGLWTAYYLARSDPSLRIAVLEKEVAGFGASGRNGGWASALFAATRERVAKGHGRGAAIALQRAMFDTVDEIGRVARAEAIDAHYHKGGTLTLATSPAHVTRIRSEVEAERAWGFAESDIRWLGRGDASEIVRVRDCYGGTFTPHCAAIHPARLARGLAAAVERYGVRLYENTPVGSIGGRTVTTPYGRVRADVVVLATEGYTPQLPGHKRRLLPLYSLMVVTERLPAGFWDEVGWSSRATVTDGRHLLIYAQRTADDRIAIGGRGAPYHFGSGVRDDFDRVPHVFQALKAVSRDLWPALRGLSFTHEWGGPLGVPRDWYSSVGLNRSEGLAWAGGYVGDGVSTANLAGRTLADLICERDTDLVHLPWVGHRSRAWEPEPLRWVGVNLALWAMSSADRREARTHRPARRADVVGKLIGL